MQLQPLHQMLENLEKSLSTIGGQSTWIQLEAIDSTMIEELSTLFPKTFFGTNSTLSPAISPSETLNQTSSLQIPQDSIPPKNRTPSSFRQATKVEISPALEPITAENQIDLDPNSAINLESLRFRLRDCTRCTLSMNRKTVVFGQGNQKASLLFVGEGPGAEEDFSGLAFVGKAGKLLTQMIHSIGINREAVYVCNVVKCRPPGNRNPKEDEIESCISFLEKQIELIQPELIVTLGNVATKALIKGAEGIMKMRGKLLHYNNIPLIPTFHPSFVLRQQSSLDDVWTDFRKIRQALFRPGN